MLDVLPPAFASAEPSCAPARSPKQRRKGRKTHHPGFDVSDPNAGFFTVHPAFHGVDSEQSRSHFVRTLS